MKLSQSTLKKVVFAHLINVDKINFPWLTTYAHLASFPVSTEVVASFIVSSCG